MPAGLETASIAIMGDHLWQPLATMGLQPEQSIVLQRVRPIRSAMPAAILHHSAASVEDRGARARDRPPNHAGDSREFPRRRVVPRFDRDAGPASHVTSEACTSLNPVRSTADA